MDILKVLHVGVTNRGQWPLECCHDASGFRPAALCDISEAGLAEARKKTGLPEAACFRDIDEAIAHAEFDCAIICAPTLFHVPFAQKLIEADKPVLVEKGMAPDWPSAQNFVRFVQEHGGVACIAQNYRYNAPERTIHDALHDGSHPAHPGELHLVSYTHNRVRPQPRTLTFPYGSVWDMSCHHFDNLLGWLGPIAEINATAWAANWSAYAHPNNTAAQLRFANGTMGHYLHTHDAARHSLRIEFHGDRGALVRDNQTITFNERPLEQFGRRELMEVDPVDARGEYDLLRDFHTYITQGIEPGISARQNLEVMAACEMVVRSAEMRRWVHRRELDRQGSLA